MSAMDRSDPLETPAERAVSLSLAASARQTTIDPLFRRRLRGRVLNGFVAAREGAALPATGSRRMSRIGRACLYASVALALSVGSVMAASRASIPGDLLYPVKRQLEAIRAEVLPAHFRDELAAYAFAQRVNELGRLIEGGDLSRATALLPDVRASLEALAAFGPDVATDDPMVATQLSVLTDLLARLPDPARDAIERALEHAPGLTLVGPPRGGNPHGPPPGQAEGPAREQRDGPDRGRPDDPKSRNDGGKDDPEDTSATRQGPAQPELVPDPTPAETPDPGVVAEPEDEPDEEPEDAPEGDSEDESD